MDAYNKSIVILFCYYRRLYWVDAYNKSIESSNMEGGQRQKEKSLLDGPYAAPLFGLALVNHTAYISTWYDGAVYSVELGPDPHPPDLIITEVDYLTDREMFAIAAVTPGQQPDGKIVFM